MQDKKRFMIYILLFVSVGILLTSCGYKPSSVFIKKIFNETVYVEVEVDRVEPENAPFVKDEMNRLVYTRFKGITTDKEQADSKIFVNYRGTTFMPIATKDGYVTRYRANIRVKFKMKTKNGTYTKSISTQHEADIQASSLLSSSLRTEAIRKGLEKALDEFIAYVSVKGALEKKKAKKSQENLKEHNTLGTD